jgi:hypothetical protein
MNALCVEKNPTDTPDFRSWVAGFARLATRPKRPIAAVRSMLAILQHGPSKRPFVRPAASRRLKHRSADKTISKSAARLLTASLDVVLIGFLEQLYLGATVWINRAQPSSEISLGQSCAGGTPGRNVLPRQDRRASDLKDAVGPTAPRPF